MTPSPARRLASDEAPPAVGGSRHRGVEERRLLRSAAFAAAGLHVAILLVPLPERAPPPVPPPPDRPPIRLTSARLEPPRMREQPPIANRPRTRPVPVPVPHPADLADPEIDPRDAPPSRDVVTGADVSFLPVAPPAVPAGPLPEDWIGLVRPRPHPGRVRPDYPAVARRIGREGVVVLTAVVGKDGRIGSIRVVRAPEVDLGFVDAAVEAVSRWTYDPGLYRGEPVSVEITVRVEFVLD